MSYPVKKIIHFIDRITEYSEYQIIFSEAITYPTILGEFQNLVPEGVESQEDKHKIVDQPLFNKAGICTLNAEIGKYGICNIQVRQGYCLRDIYCPSEIDVEIWRTNDSLIYNFYNPTELERFRIRAKLIPDKDVFKQIFSEPDNINLRKRLIDEAMLSEDDRYESRIEKLGYLTKEEVCLLADRKNRQVTYFIGKSKGKEVKPISEGKHRALLYDPVEIKKLISRKSWPSKPIEVIKHQIKIEEQHQQKKLDKSVEQLPEDFQFTKDTADNVIGYIIKKLDLIEDPLKDDASQEGLLAYLRSIQAHPDNSFPYHLKSAINGAIDFLKKEKKFQHDELKIK